MKLALYLGCVIPNRYPGIEVANRKVLPELGIELLDMEGATCCPAPGVIRSFNQDIWLLTAARNLTIAEQMGSDIISLCSGCYSSLKEANCLLKKRDDLKGEVNKDLAKINRTYNGSVKVKHLAEVLYFDVGITEIKKVVKRKIPLKVAVFYGCHLLKPSDLRPWNSVENPVFFDEMVEAFGALSVPYRKRLGCCGAGGALRSGAIDVSLSIARERLQAMKAAGAECIVVICPFCHLQFDVGQHQIAQKWDEKFNLPVFYYTQLLGLSIGFPPEEMGIHLNVVDYKNLIGQLLK